MSEADPVPEFSRILSDIRAELSASSPGGANAYLWRDQKSALMRGRILEAAITCLVERGYAKTSTQLVAVTAEVSRGAMLHHYGTKAELIEAIIDYIYYKRLEAFYMELETISDAARIEDGAALEIYWRLINMPSYTAYLELCMAGRTNPELACILRRKMVDTNSYFMDIIPYLFPEWNGVEGEAQQVALALVVVGLDGLLLNRHVIPEKARRQAVRKVLFKMVQELRSAGVGTS